MGKITSALRRLSDAYLELLHEKPPTTCEHDAGGLCYDCENEARALRW